jgi:hypothetical protein
MASLFGPSPAEILFARQKEQEQMQMLKNQQIGQQGGQFGVFAPLYQAGLKFGDIGASAMRQGLFPEQADPALMKATAIQGVLSKYADQDTNSAEVLKKISADLRTIDPDASLRALEIANKLKTEGGKIPLSASDLEKIAPEDRPRAIQAYQTTGKLPPDISFVDKPEKFRDILKNIKDNPEQAQFLLQELSQKIEANPQDAEALQQYEQVARAASEGSIAKFAAEQKDKLSRELDITRLAKYRQDLSDTERLTPTKRWDAEIDAARSLLSNYNIDNSKPLAGQVPTSVLYSPIASELTNAYERSLRKKTNEGGKPTPVAPVSSPQTATDPTLINSLKAANIPYEPAKYEYRIVNGTVQRKAKGK